MTCACAVLCFSPHFKATLAREQQQYTPLFYNVHWLSPISSIQQRNERFCHIVPRQRGADAAMRQCSSVAATLYITAQCAVLFNANSAFAKEQRKALLVCVRKRTARERWTMMACMVCGFTENSSFKDRGQCTRIVHTLVRPGLVRFSMQFVLRSTASPPFSGPSVQNDYVACAGGRSTLWSEYEFQSFLGKKN